jgi:myo-inositol-1(or 4)-monophosphatase
LTEATLSTTDPALFEPAEAAAFEQVRRTARLTRYGCDAYAYALLAAGHVDLVAESGLKPHDVRALVPVIEGAGGLVTDWRGERAWDGGQIVAAGDKRAHVDALVALKRAAS